MTYRIVHTTTYTYENLVSFGNHAAYLTPRSGPHHRVSRSELRITPEPVALTARKDYFGNEVTFFTIQEPHEQLRIEAESEVTVERDFGGWPEWTPGWERVAEALPESAAAADAEAYQFVFESPRIRPSEEFAAYARPSFPAGRPLGEALLDLTARIHRDFRFDAKATSVRTPPEEVMSERKGVCQDFAQLQIACLRSMGLAARYVSGYLRTFPPPGQPRLVGADASHAWVSAYCPGVGWLDVDPTNDLAPSDSHVTLGWGRDYGDISPVRGVILGGRDHKLDVGVDMEPIG